MAYHHSTGLGFGIVSPLHILYNHHVTGKDTATKQRKKTPVPLRSVSSNNSEVWRTINLNELKEGALERGAQGLDFLVEVDSGKRALADTLGGELEFLDISLVYCENDVSVGYS